MEVEWPAARPREAQRIWQRIIEPLAGTLRDDPAVALALTEAIRSGAPELIPDAAALDQQLASVRATLQSVAALLGPARDPRAAALPEPTVSIAHEYAHRQVALTAALRTYRLGHEFLWQWFADRLLGDTADVHEARRLVSSWLFTYVDTVSSLAERVLQTERDAWLRTAIAARTEMVTAILANRERDPKHASARLHHDVERHHVGLMVWCPSADAGDPQATMGRLVGELGRLLGTTSTLVVPDGALAVRAWLSRSRSFSEEEMRTLAGHVVTNELPLQVAVGAPASGLAGFRSSQVEAGHARRVAMLTRTAPRSITMFGDVALVALASSDAEQAAAFVERILGPLASDDEVARRTADTLAVYLEENRSRKRAAGRLHVHPNTVNYRVKQAEEILGRTVDVDALDLRVALRLLPAVRHSAAR